MTEAEARREADAREAAVAARLAPVRHLWPDDRAFRRAVSALWSTFCAALQEQRDGRGGDRRRLERVARLAGDLREELEDLSGAERAALRDASAATYAHIGSDDLWSAQSRRALAFGLDVAETKAALERIAQAAGQAEPPAPRRGKPANIVAERVATAAARLYRATGRDPTFSTCAETSVIRGQWPDLLAVVFDALDIDAAPGSHARAASARIRSESANYHT